MSVSIHVEQRTALGSVPSLLPFVLTPNTIHPTKCLILLDVCPCKQSKASFIQHWNLQHRGLQLKERNTLFACHMKTKGGVSCGKIEVTIFNTIINTIIIRITVQPLGCSVSLQKQKCRQFLSQGVYLGIKCLSWGPGVPSVTHLASGEHSRAWFSCGPLGTCNIHLK